MQYDEDVLQEINDNVILLEYVQQTIDLKSKGKDYFGQCSLHVDITPSFSLTPEKNCYYCFSCGRGGGIISYLQEYENLSFDAAVLKASELGNIDLNTMSISPTVKFLKSLRKKERKENNPHDILESSEINKYSKSIINEWIDEGIRQEEIELFNIRIDEWSNRIIYPVCDIDGNLINIKGRTRFKDYKQMKLNKYINYFKVGVVDYFQGLNITLPYIKETGEIIIFESIKSVMKLRSYGKSNSASAEKHTFTDEQIVLIIKLKVSVVLAYDSDVLYSEKKVKKNIDILKKFTDVYLIEDKKFLLGGIEAKNSPVDIDKRTWEFLYSNRRKVR